MSELGGMTGGDLAKGRLLHRRGMPTLGLGQVHHPVVRPDEERAHGPKRTPVVGGEFPADHLEGVTQPVGVERVKGRERVEVSGH